MGVGISLSGLASAVANMGGVGVISTVGIGLIGNKPYHSFKKANIDALRTEIRKARELTKGILGVNIMGVLTNFSDMVKTSIEEGIDIIFSGAGLPLDLPKYLNNGIKTKLVPIVSSSRAASIICKKWKNNFDYLPDAFVVEGPKAGGHLGFKPDELESDSNNLSNILGDVLQVSKEMQATYGKNIPVIAAGGIYSGSDMFEIMDQGASAVQLGTRFVATYECDASDEFKETYVQSDLSDIKIIKSPVGLPGRTIFNNFLSEAEKGNRKPLGCKHNCISTCNPKTTMYCIAEALVQAYSGNMEKGFAFAGANAYLVDKITSVAEVFRMLKEEYLAARIQANLI